MDIYRNISDLQTKLLKFDCEGYSLEIQEIIDAGSTGTEILMGVKWILQKGLDNNKLPVPLRNDVEKIIVDLKKLLQVC